MGYDPNAQQRIPMHRGFAAQAVVQRIGIREHFRI